MNLNSIRYFFMWNTIINGIILIVWTIVLATSADFIYQIHDKLFPVSKEIIMSNIYLLLGLFKVVFLIFNVVPLVVFTLMSNGKHR